MKKHLSLLLLCSGISFCYAQQTSEVTTPEQQPTETSSVQASIELTLSKFDPLYIIKSDGLTREVTKKEFDAITKGAKRARIQSIEVLQDEDRLMYGNRGRYGVVIVGMKPSASSGQSIPPKRDE